MDRNEILANFQACTGIDNISECIAHLEQADWNLNDAVTIALAASATSPSPQDVPTNLTSVSAETLFPQFGAQPSTSDARIINFEIRLNSKSQHVALDETAMLGDLRQLASMHLGIPKKEAKFSGWPAVGTDNMTDDTTLRSLHLPLNVTLTVETSGHVQNGATASNFSSFGLRDNLSIGSSVDFPMPCSATKVDAVLQNLNETFILQITDKKTSKSYSLQCHGSKTFEEVRIDTHSLTGIPPSKQLWEGLASNSSELTPDRTMGSLGLDQPLHICSVSSKQEMMSSPIDLTTDDETMEVDDFEDASDNFSDEFGFLNDSMMTSQLRPLMPDAAEDDVGPHVQFQSEFNSRYGVEVQVSPNFFLGSLTAAVREAFGGSARNRKLLAIYLHHDKSIQSNVFCTQLLCAPSVVEYMSLHSVIWAWDITSDHNKEKLLEMCSRLFGSGVADTVKRVPRDGFPMLVLAQGRGRSCEVNSIIQGNTSLDELMGKLMQAVDDVDHQKQEDIRMEEISEARERIKREQEKAYEESLKLDMEKQKKIDEEKAEIDRQRKEAEREEQLQNEKIEQLSQIVPTEPDPNCGKPIARIRFRPPCGGDVVTRTFLASEKLQGLLNFVGSLGYLSEKYRVITSYPKRDVSSLDPKLSLKEHKLFPQETLIIEERID